METVRSSFKKASPFYSINFVWICIAGLIILFLPSQSALATSGIANTVAAFCAPEPTMPDVGTCSACHSTTNNRGPNDLTAAGIQSQAGNYAFFCPNAAATPAPTPTPTTPPPGSPGSAPGTGSMGMGVGATDDDDDDDDERETEDDDD